MVFELKDNPSLNWDFLDDINCNELGIDLVWHGKQLGFCLEIYSSTLFYTFDWSNFKEVSNLEQKKSTKNLVLLIN